MTGAMACALLIISIVWPSGGAVATALAAVVPPAPTRFSTTTAWPRISDSGWATMRAAMSVPPPAPNPTIRRIGRVGQSCACARPAKKMAAHASSMAAGRDASREHTGLRFLVLDRVAQDSDPFDLDLADVALLHPHRWLARAADTGRRSCDDDVARLERHSLADIGQRLGHREHHVLGVVG